MENEDIEVEHSTIPACLSNPTLGAAANGVFLDVMDAQITENRRAEIEGRPARIAKRDERFPGYVKPESTPSYVEDVDFGTHYTDGEMVMFPQGGPEVPAAGLMAQAHKTLAKGSHGVAQRSKARSGTTTQEGGSTPQKGTETPSQASGVKREHS